MIPNIYKGNYKLLIIFPLIIILASIYFIPQIKAGVDFRGGTLVRLTLPAPVDGEQLQKQLAEEGLPATVRSYALPTGAVAEIEVEQSEDLLKAEALKTNFTDLFGKISTLETQSNGTIATTERAKIYAVANSMFALAKLDKKAEEIDNINILSKEFSAAYAKVYENYRAFISGPIDKHVKYSALSVQTVSPLLQGRFVEQAVQASIASAIVSAIFVFLFFRTFVPSLAVLMGALSDVIIAMGAMGLFGIPFTLPALAALFMLVGFSLDTDMLLTIRMLRRQGDPRDKAFDAMKTGMTMSLAAIVAFGVLFILAMYTRISTYYEISAIALAGLVGDLFATWGINAVMILYYVEKKEGAKK
jgi:preprotein translocase subunit SecF